MAVTQKVVGNSQVVEFERWTAKRKAEVVLEIIKGKVTLVADVSERASRAASLACEKALKMAAGNQGCWVHKVLRMPTTCMMGKMPVFLK